MLNLGENDLKSPHSDFIQAVHRQLLRCLLGNEVLVSTISLRYYRDCSESCRASLLLLQLLTLTKQLQKFILII